MIWVLFFILLIPACMFKGWVLERMEEDNRAAKRAMALELSAKYNRRPYP